MPVTWTEEQKRAIEERDKDLLVSAAAGSGKTAVLVERVLRRITDEENPVDIDRLLVVTFTKAAAAQMRERIRDSLFERAQMDPGNEHLQKQLVLVNNAEITTIDSFCVRVLRNHFEAAGVDPTFRVADTDGGEVMLLEQDTVKEVVDEAYEQEDAGEFGEFLEQFSTGRGDDEVEAAILDLYHFALGQPFPKDWLFSCARMYDEKECRFLTDDTEAKPAWMKFVESDTAARLLDVKRQLNEAIAITGEPDGPGPYEKSLLNALSLIDKLTSCHSYASYAEAFCQVGNFEPIGRISGKKAALVSKKKKERVHALWNDCKDTLLSLKETYYYDDPAVLEDELLKSGVIIRELTRLTGIFMDRLAKKKADKKVLDFSDLEHFALQILVQKDPEKPDTFIPSAAANEYAQTFEEVITDEYQDINLVQEMILKSVSGRGRDAHNRFMVGDVKQSIYRFRLARPELFMDKFHRYRDDRDKTECRIDLHLNFRSRPQVIDSVNGIFEKIMTEPLGGVAYDDDAALVPGAEYPGDLSDAGDSYRTELLLADTKAESEKTSSSPERTPRQEEAAMVGRRIRELVGSLPVLDEKSNELRSARYGDIVILLRATKGWAEPFAEVLQEMGIPCQSGSREGYFSAAEVRVVLSYLEILDNPLQDIPLAAVLRSAIGNLSDEELCAIRLAGRNCPKASFYDCCRIYMEKDADDSEDDGTKEKLKKFFAVYENLRAKAEYTPVHRLLWELLDETGYGAYASALPAGRQRKANLDMLVEKAIAYEKTSYRGLYHFVRYIENIQKYETDFGEASPGAEPDNCVRILSIHQSKGLEYPIVFVCALGKGFNKLDLRGQVIMHPQWGIACNYVRHQGGELPLMSRPTLFKETIRQRLLSEMLGEEIRLLYVAMTRAKEKLILTGSADDYDKEILSWRAAAADAKDQALSYSRLISASSALDWVVPAYLSGRGEEEIRVIEPVSEKTQEEAEKMSGASFLAALLHLEADTCFSEKARDYLERVSASSYPYESVLSLPGKLTVSELKKQSRHQKEDDSQMVYPFKPADPLIPKFMRADEPDEDAGAGLTGAGRGTAYHTFMENLDYSRKEELQLQLKELVSCGKLSGEEMASIRLRDITDFLDSDIGRRMECAALAGTLNREQPFVLGVSASEIYPEESFSGPGKDEIILVQGIIDAYFTEGKKITLVDYKTDRVRDEEELVRRYRAQMESYARALSQILRCPVGDAVIYSFSLKREIHLSL